MVLLAELPPELLYNVFIHVDPADLAWLPRVCRSFSHAISQNGPLFKQVYLRNLDTPPAHDGQKLDWIRAIQDLVRLQVICQRDSIDDKKDELPFVHDTVTSLLNNAAYGRGSSPTPFSRNSELLGTIFSDPTNQAAFLCRSFLYERARGESKYGVLPSPPRAEHQQSAHLHCLYGRPLLHPHPTSSAAAAGRRATRAMTHADSEMRPFACSKVYDLRQYTPRTLWGPFMDDGTGRVDWEKVEAIMIVLGANLRQLGLDKTPLCQRVWHTPFSGVWPQSYSPLSPSLSPAMTRFSGLWDTGKGKGKSQGVDGEEETKEEALNRQDPYGVGGVWLRVVCFLDYTDFFAYNFSAGGQPPPNVPRLAIDAGEATRLILMKLWVTAIDDKGPENSQALPVVHFQGFSRSMDTRLGDDANSGIRGTVRMTPEGEVRWTTWSVFAGQERWRSESIQVGGVRSARGVLGNWFDKDFDPRGPVGPTGFWKISDKGLTKDNIVGMPMEEVEYDNVMDEDDEEDEDDDYDDELPQAGGGNDDEIQGVDGAENADYLDPELENDAPPSATELETRDMIFTNWTERYES